MNKIIFEPEGHIYTTPEGKVIPSVSEILEHFGLSDFSYVNQDVLEAAQKFGNVVHDTTRLFDMDDLESCDPIIEPYLGWWIKFKEDYKIDKFDIIEVPLYSKIWGFAGTPDRLAGSMLPDIKTGAKMVSHKVQTAFYQILIEENYKIKIKQRLSVYLKPGKYVASPHKDKTDISIAKSLIQIYNFKKREKLL